MIKRDTRKDTLLIKVVDTFRDGELLSSTVTFFGLFTFNNKRA